MKPLAFKPATPWLLAAGLLALLLLLASLQYRWLDAVSRADRDKTRAVLQTAADRFAEDFDRELTRAFLDFQPRGDEGFLDKLERWQSVAPFPELVHGVFTTRLTPTEGLELSRFDPGADAFGVVPWPAGLDALRQRLSGGTWPRRSRGQPPDLNFLAADVPALVLPFFGPPAPGSRPPRGPGPREPFGPRDVAIVWLDREVILGEVLPELTGRYLSEYHVRVVTADFSREVFRGGAPLSGVEKRGGDAGAPLFALLPVEKLGSLTAEAPWTGRPGLDDGGPPGRPPRRGDRGHWFRRLYGIASQQSDAAWRLVVSHPAGSLDAAVTRAHRSNLAISFGILLLLAASLILMLLSTRRVQATARQQLDFVAGVTHELLTPLAAMRSAGQNLADGVVDDAARVKRYGRLIDDEGRRLTRMVGQVLELAGMQAGGRTYALRRSSLARVIEDALDEYRPVLDEKGFTVETRIAADLPQVMADAAALRRAIQNLIANAVKYGEEGSWIGITAAAEARPAGSEVALSVEDRGPGIAAADLPRLFEPFYRGQDGTREQIPGSGLGLSLVKHIAEGHGGRVDVETAEGRGTKFTLRLPAAPAADGSDPHV